MIRKFVQVIAWSVVGIVGLIIVSYLIAVVINQMRAAEVTSAVPDNWRIAVSESELSMRRCLVGEWMYMSAALRNTNVDLVALREDSVFARAMRGLTAPL